MPKRLLCCFCGLVLFLPVALTFPTTSIQFFLRLSTRRKSILWSPTVTRMGGPDEDLRTSMIKGGSDATDGEARTKAETITILGFGSLLSERSSRLTFPDLANFRLARVPNYRRVFGHPTSIFFQRGIADLETKQMSSLSAEYCENNKGFVASVFEIPNDDNVMKDGVPSLAFLEREEEFDFLVVPYEELDSGDSVHRGEQSQKGILCARSTDATYLDRWDQARFDDHFTRYGIDSIWNWTPDSGLRPCAIYLRHCYLAAKNAGDVCLDSFLDETFLVDRTTTIRQYLDEYPDVLQCKPPAELEERYSG